MKMSIKNIGRSKKEIHFLNFTGLSVVLLMTTGMLTGCSNLMPQKQQKPVFVQPAHFVDDRPRLISVPSSNNNFALRYGNDPALSKAFNQYLKTGKAPNIVTNGFEVLAYNSTNAPIIQLAPFVLTTIQLEPGEKYTNVSIGDTSRWKLAASVSGSGSNQRQNVMVEPSEANLSTNLTIATNKRLYQIQLLSSADGAKAGRTISFWYPDEMVENINSDTIKNTDNGGTIASVPDINLNNLNFDYYVSSGGLFSSGPYWKPTRVFDDRQHTYIQFPASMTARDMPVLYVLDGTDKQMVNYRSKPPYFVVDKLFKKAVLIMGVGQQQTEVTITNGHEKS